MPQCWLSVFQYAPDFGCTQLGSSSMLGFSLPLLGILDGWKFEKVFFMLGFERCDLFTPLYFVQILRPTEGRVIFFPWPVMPRFGCLTPSCTGFFHLSSIYSPRHQPNCESMVLVTSIFATSSLWTKTRRRFHLLGLLALRG